tara:strand:+ start:202 stop:585 length:384 start_codon:yes stop_codon:yes gene_type:complete
MALVKLRARLRAGSSGQMTDADRLTNEQAIAVARGQAALPAFVANGTEKWQEIRKAYRHAASALDATGSTEDREIASDVSGFLDKHQGMNATPEVFAAHHSRLLNRASLLKDVIAPDQPPPEKERSR